MKLIIKEYLASLKERRELDAVIPDLLSQMGLNVFSRPGVGTLQHGVDVAAVGRIDDGPEKVYLFSIKPGDLGRKDWSTESPQSLRPSLTEILDSYIPHRLPAEHSDKRIVICIAIGGDILEPVRDSVTGFTTQHTTARVSFEEWNGDKIADRIQATFLREDLLPAQARSQLRKSLALLDEPDTSFRHFSALARALSQAAKTDAEKLTALRQISICLWILFSWAREAGNLESAYKAAERSLLHGWDISRAFLGRSTKTGDAMPLVFLSIYSTYHQITSAFLRQNVLPYVHQLHAISTAVHGSSDLDINLKLFDLVGRLGMDGLWVHWNITRLEDGSEDLKAHIEESNQYADAISALIENNPVLVLPIRDDQAIDIFIAVAFLVANGKHLDAARSWISQIAGAAYFTHRFDGRYPCTLRSYADLLEHPKKGDEEYKKNVTRGSILYPYLALWAALLSEQETYGIARTLKKEYLQHCTFQFWFPDDHSEDALYTGGEAHGATLTNVPIERPEAEFLAQCFGECTASPQFHSLSSVKAGWWPLVVVACRHFRLPPPPHLLADFYTRGDLEVEA